VLKLKSRDEMTKGARYSTFKESSIRDSWTIRKIAQFINSICLLNCCGSFCCAGQRTSLTSRSNEADKKNISTVESEIPWNDSVKSESDIELTMEDILTKRDYEVTKDSVLSTTLDTSKNEEISLINRKDDSLLNNSKYRSSSSNTVFNSGMKRMIINLPILPKKEKKSLVDDEKKVSESNSEETDLTNTFTKCSKRYMQQKTATVIAELIIS